MRCECCGVRFPARLLFTFRGIKWCAICTSTMIISLERNPLIGPPKELQTWLEYTRHWMRTEEGGFFAFINFSKHAAEEQGENVMITPVIRTSFVNVWAARTTPDGNSKKYSICALIDKTDAEGLAQINAEVQKAIAKGIETGKFPKTAVRALRLPLRDGDAEFEAGTRGPEFKGKYFFNATRDEAKGAPGVAKPQNGAVVPVMNQDDFYSGCRARLDVNFFPYNTAGNKGIGVGLNNCLFVGDGERLDGRMKAEDAFSKYADLPEVPGTDDDIPF